MFDRAAKSYDQTFTNTQIGRLQRDLIMFYMDRLVNNNSKLKILELNAGTGADAIYFANLGHEVVATDISGDMLKVAADKLESHDLPGNVELVCCDIRRIKEQGLKMEYDLVFSDFGGLNCLQPCELNKLSDDLMHLLKPGGRFISVLMPQYCFWESLYFFLKLETKKMVRRNTNESLKVNVDGELVDTWYYSPGRYYEIMSEHFRRVALRPVGFFIPPSYLEPAFKKNKKILKILAKFDRTFFGFSLLANYSDHFLIDMERITI